MSQSEGIVEGEEDCLVFEVSRGEDEEVESGCEGNGDDRKEVFLRRTGPEPVVRDDEDGSGSWERSAMSHGFRKSGASSSAEIQGS